MNDKAIRSAKLTAAGVLDKARAHTAVTRAGGQIAPSKYLPDVPRQVHAGGGRALPHGYSLKVDPDRLGVLARFKGRNVGQLTLSRDRETGKLSAFKMAVHPDHQRKGLMSAMHDAAEDAFGPMEPDKTLTDDGFAFWKGYRPDAVSNNLRFHTDKLMGQTVKTPYGPGTVRSVGSTGMNAELENGNTGWARAADNEDVLRNVGIDPSTLKYAKGGAVDFLRGNHPLVPDVLYHGTARDVRSFDPQAKRSYDVDPSNPEDTDTGWFGKGHYFTAKPSVASHYAKEGAKRQGDQGANIIAAHISLKNPFVVDMKAYDSGATNLDQALTRAGVPMHPRGWRKPSEQTAALMAMGHDGVIATREGQPEEYVAFKPEQIKSALSARKFDPTSPDMTYAEGGAVPQKTVKAYKLFRRKGGQLYPLFVNAEKPVPMGEWIDAEEGPQGKAQGKVKSKLGDLAYRPGWHAGDLPVATHIGGKSSPDLKAPDYRPDNHVWAEVEMPNDVDWQSEANARAKVNKAGQPILNTAHITDQLPKGGFYRYKTNPNMTGNWLIGGSMKVNRVLSDEEVKAINDQAGTADLPRRSEGFAAGGAAMFEGIHEDLTNEDGTPKELWHGTPGAGFEAFDDAKLGNRDAGFYGRGHYLTPIKGNAEGYADPDEMGAGTVMGPLHAALKNPYVWDTSDQGSHKTLRDLQSMGIMREKNELNPWDNLQQHHIKPFMSEMKKRGHDGVIVKTEGGISEVVAFDPKTIKHRDAEVFDPNDPRIMRDDGGRIGKAYGGSFGYVPQAALPQLRLAVAQPLPQAQPKGGSWLNTLTDLAVAAKKPEETAAPVHGFGATMPPSSTPAPTSGAAPQTGNMSGFYAPFKSDLDRLIAEAPGAVTVTSGYRTPERQQELWDQNAAKYPDPEVRDNYVARPGHSSHNYGLAADLSFASPEVQQWVHDNAAKYNLQFRMDHEGWHVEPINVWELRDQLGPPAGYADGGNVTDITLPLAARAASADAPSQGFKTLTGNMQDRFKASADAYQAAKDDGAFDNVQMGDVYKYNLSPNSPPMRVVSHTMRHVNTWGGEAPPEKVYRDHYPVAELERQDTKNVAVYPVELIEKSGKYTLMGRTPRAVKAGGGEVDDPMFGHHNMSAKGVEVASGLGGIPMPSMAISKVAHPLENFGDVTLMAHPSMVTPSRDTNVWPADTYTGRQPRGDEEFSDPKAINRAMQADPNFGHMRDITYWHDATNSVTNADEMMKTAQLGVARGIDPKQHASFHDYVSDVRQKLGYEAYKNDHMPGLRAYGDIKRVLYPKDLFTSSGNRKKPVDYTLENVMKRMKGAAEAGAEGFNYGPGNFRAIHTPKFASMGEIKSDRGLIIPSEQMKPIKSQFEDAYSGLVEKLVQATGRKGFRAYDEAADALTDISKGRRHDWFGDVPPELVSQIRELGRHASKMPTEYFEAKSKRAIPLSAFPAALVPKSDPESARRLTEAGVKKVMTYGSPEERVAMYRSQPDLMFKNGGKALALTRGFTKDGKAAMMALKSKGN